MILTIRVPQGYKTPGSLEEAARVMGGQLTDLKLVDAPENYRRPYDWQATIVVPKKVVVHVDPEGGDWVPGWQRLEEEDARLDAEEARDENG